MSFNFVEKVMCIGGKGSLPPVFQFYKRGFVLGGTGASPSWQDIILSGNTALTLTNALADGLNYLKLFGGTEQRNLPSGYTQVEYLESSGTQYIDAGVVPTKNTKIEIRNIQKSTDTSFGVAGQLYAFNTGGNNYYSFGGAPNAGTFTGAYLINLDATIVMSKDDGLVINGQQVVAFSDVSDFTTDLTFWLFARNNTTESYKMGTQRTYYFKMWNNGALIRNLIPCRRNSDNVLGMYDTVTDTFLTNAGTGTFTAGADIVPTPTTPMDIVCNNGVLKAFKTLNISTYDTSASDAGIDITFDGATDRRRWNTLNDSGTGTKHYENGFVSIYMDTSGNTYYAKALANGIVYGGSVYNTGEQIYTWQYNIAKNINIYCPTIYTDGTTETVEITGKNLFDQAIFNTDVGTTITYEWLQIPNGTYTMSTNFPPKTSTQYTNVWVLSGKQTGGADSTANGVSLGYPKTITVTDGWYTIAYRNTVGDIQRNPKDYNWQVEQGSTATAYEPYTVLDTATAENLFKIGTYQDVQSVIDGDVTRNIGIKVLDGTEDWVKSGSYAGAFYVGYSNSFDPIKFAQGACTHAKWVDSSSFTQDTCYNGNAAFIIWNSNFNASSTVDEWKQWLQDQYNSGNPVVVVYPLATSTTETVTAQPLTTQVGTNNVTITQASMDNLGLEVSYKATV